MDEGVQNKEGARGPHRQRSLSADWIIDESWWGEGAELPADRADAGAQLHAVGHSAAGGPAKAGPELVGEGAELPVDRAEASAQLHAVGHSAAAGPGKAGPAAVQRPLSTPHAPPRKHREMRVYLGASTWVSRPGFVCADDARCPLLHACHVALNPAECRYLLIPVEYSSTTVAATTEPKSGTEAAGEALVVSRNAPHTIMPASQERVRFLKAHARDVIVAQALLGIAQLEWEAFLVLMTASQVVAKLPQGELRRVTDAKILPIGIDNVGVHWHSGQVLSSPHGMLSVGGASGDRAGVMAKRAFILRSFKDLLKSGWLLFSWDFDCSHNQQTLAAAMQRNMARDSCAAHTHGEQAALDRSPSSCTPGARVQLCPEKEGGRSGGEVAAGSGVEGRHGKESWKEWCLDECVKRGWDCRFVWNATWMEPVLRSASKQVSVERWLVPLVYGALSLPLSLSFFSLSLPLSLFPLSFPPSLLPSLSPARPPTRPPSQWLMSLVSGVCTTAFKHAGLQW